MSSWIKARLHKGKIQVQWRQDGKTRTKTVSKEQARHIAAVLKSASGTLRVLAE